MSIEQVRNVIENELGGRSITETFSWIDLAQPVGSATIAQVN